MGFKNHFQQRQTIIYYYHLSEFIIEVHNI